MSDKFKVNFRIVLPGAIISMIILGVLTHSATINSSKNYDFDLVKVIPYLLVLILALIGINVIIVLIGGTVLSGIIGLLDGSFNWIKFLKLLLKV